MGRLALIYWLLLEHCYHTATIWQRPWEERRSRTNSPHCDCLSDEPKSRRFEDIPWAVASGDHSTFRRDYTKRPSMSWSLSEICSGTVLDSCGTGVTRPAPTLFADTRIQKASTTIHLVLTPCRCRNTGSNPERDTIELA